MHEVTARVVEIRPYFNILSCYHDKVKEEVVGSKYQAKLEIVHELLDETAVLTKQVANMLGWEIVKELNNGNVVCNCKGRYIYKYIEVPNSYLSGKEKEDIFLPSIAFMKHVLLEWYGANHIDRTSQRIMTTLLAEFGEEETFNFFNKIMGITYKRYNPKSAYHTFREKLTIHPGMLVDLNVDPTNVVEPSSIMRWGRRKAKQPMATTIPLFPQEEEEEVTSVNDLICMEGSPLFKDKIENVKAAFSIRDTQKKK